MMIHSIEIRAVRFPVIRVPGHRDRLVRFEFDTLERTGADRMLAHVSRRDVAGVDRRPPGRQQGEKGTLRPFQMKGDLIVAVRRHLREVAVPALARIDAELLAGPAGEEIPGAFDVLGGERLAVVPFDALTQREGQLGPLFVPGPAGGKVRDDRPQAVLRHVLIEYHQVVNTPIIGRLTATVDSSSSDMLAGLSKWVTLRMPPCFCANAASAENADSSAPATTSTRRCLFISICLLFIMPALTSGSFGELLYRSATSERLSPIGRERQGVSSVRSRRCGRRCRGWLPVEPDVFHACAVEDAVDHDRQPLHRGCQQV